jgi:hypothetical protein
VRFIEVLREMTPRVQTRLYIGSCSAAQKRRQYHGCAAQKGVLEMTVRAEDRQSVPINDRTAFPR